MVAVPPPEADREEEKVKNVKNERDFIDYFVGRRDDW